MLALSSFFASLHRSLGTVCTYLFTPSNPAAHPHARRPDTFPRESSSVLSQESAEQAAYDIRKHCSLFQRPVYSWRTLTWPMIRHERCRSAGMLSLFSSRHTIKAIFALGLLGVVIAFHQLLLSDHGYNVGTTSFRNGTGSISSVNFFRIWHPPWTRTEKNSQATKFNPEGPECSRTLLYRFAGAHGFASEYLIFLRVVLLAKHFRYEVIIDDSQWNYGRWTESV